MRLQLGCVLAGAVLMGSVAVAGQDRIVYTAHQGFDSRVYILDMDGTPETYFHYSNFRLVDCEVVDNQVYLAEAFAPRVERLDLANGDLEVIIDDWSLFYFYGLAFDGTYFYVDEWDLNRYLIDGTKDGVAGFDESVMGAASDGTYLWTLNDVNQIRCWDISGWPAVAAVPANDFTPPSPHCRGLWFDGEYFWTAESLEDSLGYIYQFDRTGAVVNQWLEPAFSGWSACVVRDTGPLFADGFESGDTTAWSLKDHRPSR